MASRVTRAKVVEVVLFAAGALFLLVGMIGVTSPVTAIDASGETAQCGPAFTAQPYRNCGDAKTYRLVWAIPAVIVGVIALHVAVWPTRNPERRTLP